MKKYLVGQLCTNDSKVGYEFKFIDIIISESEDDYDIVSLYNKRYDKDTSTAVVIGEVYENSVILYKDMLPYVNNGDIIKIIDENKNDKDYKKMWNELKKRLNLELDDLEKDLGFDVAMFREFDTYKNILSAINKIEEEQDE